MASADMNLCVTKTFKAAADLSSYQYHFMYISAAGTVNVAGANAKTCGILLNKPDAANKEALVAMPGSICPLVAGEDFAAGKYLTAKSDGHGEIADAAGEHVGAYAYQAAAAANDIVTVGVVCFEAYDSDA